MLSCRYSDEIIDACATDVCTNGCLWPLWPTGYPDSI